MSYGNPGCTAFGALSVVSIRRLGVVLVRITLGASCLILKKNSQTYFRRAGGLGFIVEGCGLRVEARNLEPRNPDHKPLNPQPLIQCLRSEFRFLGAPYSRA